jgi:hypothetical protein
MGRRTLLTSARIEEIALAVEFGARPESVGVSSRSVRRWRHAERAALERLSVAAKLELRLREAEERVRTLGWETTAALLDDLSRDDVLAGPRPARRWFPTARAQHGCAVRGRA